MTGCEKGVVDCPPSLSLPLAACHYHSQSVIMTWHCLSMLT